MEHCRLAYGNIICFHGLDAIGIQDVIHNLGHHILSREKTMGSDTLFEQALEVGRPPTVKRLFPHSRALLVSGKVVNRALARKGQAMTIAANGRNYFVIQGALLAAQ